MLPGWESPNPRDINCYGRTHQEDQCNERSNGYILTSFRVRISEIQTVGPINSAFFTCFIIPSDLAWTSEDAPKIWDPKWWNRRFGLQMEINEFSQSTVQIPQLECFFLSMSFVPFAKSLPSQNSDSDILLTMTGTVASGASAWCLRSSCRNSIVSCRKSKESKPSYAASNKRWKTFQIEIFKVKKLAQNLILKKGQSPWLFAAFDLQSWSLANLFDLRELLWANKIVIRVSQWKHNNRAYFVNQ